MLSMSQFQFDLQQRAYKLGFNKATPTVNVSFRYMIKEVNEDGSRHVHERLCYYGNSTPKEYDIDTVWMRHDNKKCFRYDFVDGFVEEDRLSELHEANY